MIKYGIAIIVILIVGYILTLLFYMKYLKRKKLVYPINEKNNVNVTKDYIYKKVADKNLYMDVYSPIGIDIKDKLPVVIFVHGEGPEIMIKDAKNWGVYTSYGKLLASKGYVAVTFNHRYADKDFTKIKEVSEDVVDAVKYIQANYESWNVDLNKIFVWTFSLGGLYTSAFLYNNFNIKGVISYYGLLDINTRIPLKVQGNYDEFTPDTYLRKVSNTKILIVKATKDKIKGVNQSIDHFTQAADKYHVDYEYLVHSTGGHSFDVFVDNVETREVIEKTLKFIEYHSQSR